MSDPKRLLDGEGLAARLLSSARPDAPRARAFKRTAAAIGVTTGVSGLTALKVAGATAVASSWLGGAAVSKIVVWTLVTAVVGGTVGFEVAVHARAGGQAQIVTVVPPVEVVAATAPAPVALDPGPPALPVVSVAESPPVGQLEAHAVASAVPRSTAASTTGLASELASLDQVQSALREQDGKAALRLLNGYEESHPHGELAPEAAVLRIEALEDVGDQVLALSRAQAFLTAFPGAPQSRHIRAVVKRLEGSDGRP